MPETPQQSLLRRMFGNKQPSPESFGVSQPTKEPGMLQKIYNYPSEFYNSLFEPSAFLTSVYGGRRNDINLDNEPSMFQRGMNKLSNAVNNPALLNSILGPNQMLNIQDEKLDPNLALGINSSPTKNRILSKTYDSASNKR